MIVVIAPVKDMKNEISILNQLFKAGLEYFHLRKPNKDYDEHCEYLNQIDKKYHNRIVVHLFHELINIYDLKGIHFQEIRRREYIEVPSNYFENLNLSGKTISSSFHDPNELSQCEFNFDYYLLSPVFTSISKADYKGKEFDVNHIDKYIVGMGGATSENLSEFTKLGFKGIGVLGGIWESATPISDFKKMKNYFTQYKGFN